MTSPIPDLTTTGRAGRPAPSCRSAARVLLQEKHGVKSPRCWRKLHLAFDVGTGLIVAHTLNDQSGNDWSQVTPLLDEILARSGRSSSMAV
ncbi:transposase [Paraburkholderia aromaticivorans]|uniref:transposase n=1 Tax=Paraburkholderia aromaticivorans TaxID=2026199 RepID=UPI001456151C|nr:transposase [Paraburkholderia aromaticivorans]